MHLFKRFSAVAVAILLLTEGGSSLQAQSARAVAQTQRVFGDVESGAVTRLKGHVPAWANAANDLGAISPSRHLDNLHLVLARSPQVEAAFEQLLADQQNPASPRYHQWLTPKQNADQYGIAAADLTAVTDWMKSKGLSVDGVSGGGLFTTFSGPVSVVENAFSTSLHNFAHEHSTRYAPTTEPAIPAALNGLIASVAGLTEQMAYVQSRAGALEGGASGDAQPLYNTSSGSHFLSPGDFNTIYNINATLNAGVNGSGIRVVNLIDSRIAAADITGFNSVFGLAVAQPNQILLPGSTDPGLSSSSEGEAALDVQRILGTAPGATVDLLVMSSLSFNNIYSALQYEVGTLNDPIVNMSFGACNSGSSTSQSQAFDSYFKTGAAQGISFFVSSGDNAAAGCDSGSTTIPATQVLATNLICASGYATCVGGTEFAEQSGSYWVGSNSSTRVSATGYIPEGAWDEPTFVSNGKTSYQASGTGGGVTLSPKPSWQAGAGVPADGVRDVPDVSFTSAYRDGYLVCQADNGNDCSAGTFKYIIFGTSASSPSMAGIAALLDQKLGARQGNLNPLFYKLAATPSNGVFHDVTVASSGVSSCSTATPSMCNNSTPSGTALTGGLAGYAVGDGYDLATGLGSLDVANFLTAAALSTTVSTSLALTASANPILTSQSVTFTATLTPASTATGTVQFYSNGSALGSAVALNAGTATTPALTFSTAGTYAITAAYPGDASFGASTSAAVALVVSSPVVPSFTLTAASGGLSFVSGATAGNSDTIVVGSVNGFTGTVALSCTVAPASAAVGCLMTPASATLVSGSTVPVSAVITTSAQTSAAHALLGTGAETGGVVFALLVCLVPFRRRKGIRSLAAFAAVFGVLAVLSGCGSGGSLSSPAATLSSPRSYTVTVTGTGTPAGSSVPSTVSTTFTVTVD